MTGQTVSRNDVLLYWQKPNDGRNSPESFLSSEVWEERSQFLLEIIRKYASRKSRILDIGCNSGRNLDYLYRDGFRKLSGIELSEDAVTLLKQTFPKMANRIRIHNVPVESVIRRFKDNRFDIVFTMTVLYHIHTDSDWIFPEIARITNKHLITIENEYAKTHWTHFARNYKQVFQELGMKQIEEIDCGKTALPTGCSENFFARVFRKG